MSGDVGAEVALTEKEWDALLDSWSCDYCEPEKRGLREEFNALIAVREREAVRRWIQDAPADVLGGIIEAAKAQALRPIRELADDWERTAPLCSDEEESVRRLLVSQLRAAALDSEATS